MPRFDDFGGASLTRSVAHDQFLHHIVVDMLDNVTTSRSKVDHRMEIALDILHCKVS